MYRNTKYECTLIEKAMHNAIFNSCTTGKISAQLLKRNAQQIAFEEGNRYAVIFSSFWDKD